MDINYLLDVVHKFGSNNRELIYKTDFKGWNAWQILNKPVFYFVKNNVLKQPKPQGKTQSYVLKKVFALINYAFKVLFLALFRSKSLLIFTKTNVKSAKDKEGRFLDVLFDPFLLHAYKGKFIYFEATDSKGFKSPVAIKHDLDYNGVGFLGFILKKFLAKDAELKSVARLFTDNLNAHFQENQVAFTLNQSAVEMLLLNFYADYLIHKFVFGLLRPKAIFFEDGIPTGGMAAARKRKIRNFEFQHGFFTSSKLDYYLDPALKPLKYKMAVPDYFAVFGNFPKDQLVDSGFWDPEEIVVLGNYRIQRYREMKKEVQFKKVNSEGYSLLLATQPSAFNHAFLALTELAALKPTGLKLTIKCHVRDPQPNQEWFAKFASENPDWVQMAPSDSNLVELMMTHDLMASFFSTSIFEAVALSVPAISIGTPEHPRGVYELVDINVEGSIKTVSNGSELFALLHKFQASETFRNEWQRECQEHANYFYDMQYETNLVKLQEFI